MPLLCTSTNIFTDTMTTAILLTVAVIVRADIIHIFLPLVAILATNHTAATIPAIQNPGIHICFTLPGNSLGITAHKNLHRIKIHLADNWLVSIFKNNPVALRNLDFLLHLMTDCGSLPLRQSSGIHHIFQDSYNGLGRPFGLSCPLKTGIVFLAAFCLIFRRRKHTVFIQNLSNPHSTYPCQFLGKNTLHHTCRIRIRHQQIFIILRLFISIRRKGSDKLPVHSFYLLTGTHL